MGPPPGQLDDGVASMLVNITDMHDFKHEVTVEEALTLNQVEKRAREQGRVWWSYEANKGPYWFLEEAPASITGVHIRANLQATLQQATNNLSMHLHHHHHSLSSSSSTASSSSLPASASCPAACSAGALPGPGLFGSMSTPTVLKRLVRKGIPPHLRPRVWKAVSGAAKKEAVAPDDYYSSLVEETTWRTTDHTLQIDHVSSLVFCLFPPSTGCSNFYVCKVNISPALPISPHLSPTLSLPNYPHPSPMSPRVPPSSPNFSHLPLLPPISPHLYLNLPPSLLSLPSPLALPPFFPLIPPSFLPPSISLPAPPPTSAHLPPPFPSSPPILPTPKSPPSPLNQDLHRTFPKHPRMDTPESLAALRRVLVAYSFRDSHVGYCQGMNYVAAYLLLVMRSEEDAFWMLATLVENVLYDDCFAEDLFGVHVEQRVLKDLLKKKQPKLASHLDKVGFELSLVTTEWFLCVFAKTFPSETTLRVWDVLFNEGAKVLFRVALALFKINEAELMTAQHLGDVVEILNRSSSRHFDPDILLQVRPYPHAPPSHLLSCECCVKVAFDRVAFDRLGTMSMATFSSNASGRAFNHPFTASPLSLCLSSRYEEEPAAAEVNHRTVLPPGALFRDASAACGSRNSRSRGALGGALKGGVGVGRGWGGFDEMEKIREEERAEWAREGFTPPQGLPPRVASHLNLNLNSVSVSRMHAAAEAALSVFSAASEVSSVAAASVSLAMGSREAESGLIRTNSI
ncbi:unnamed protein product [Closterium sp. Naga37s-1]|nr:unnamed protein product [Closterium sp. Naga37s-1]